MNTWSASFQNFLQQHPLLEMPFLNPTWEVTETPQALATKEEFWSTVQADFPFTDNPINLNSGAVSSSPLVVENAYLHFYKLMNTAPSYFLWGVMEKGKEIIREGLSQLIHCSTDEIAILRNTTEAMNNIIFGLPLQQGDEVVLCRQDYAKVTSSWKQRALREGLVLNWVDINPVTDSNEEIVQKYVAAFTEKTKLLNLTHVINWNGQVLPVKEIIAAARKRNIEVILDAAHSFGKLEVDLSELACDYCAATLHKWLSGPVTSAMLFIRKEKIAGVWPLSSSNDPHADNIRKFEELSIQLYPNILALGFAIDYYHQIGRPVKEARLRYLRKRWTEPLRPNKKIKWQTPLEEERCCTIVNISLEGYDPPTLEKILLNKYHIHVGIVQLPKLEGIRVTPNIYTKVESLDRLVAALNELSE